jgi:CAAX prenyl protease-like protein
MRSLRDWLGAAPERSRVVPFAVFVLFTMGQGQFQAASAYWVYALKTLLGAGLLWLVWPLVPEMRWRFSWQAVGTGVVVFAMWVGMDPAYPKLDQLMGSQPKAPAPQWNPFTLYGQGGVLAWFYVVVRVVGSTLVVPPLEEVFYRSFLYRYIIKKDFLSVPLATMAAGSLMLCAVVFGLAHREWLAGIICAIAYQLLVCRTGRLGDAMTAHAITNFLLGCWVVWRGEWRFW